MIKKLLCLLVLLLTATTGAWAQTETQWTSGDCTVTLSDGVLTVSGTGAMADYKDFYTDLPWYGQDIKTIVIESGVTSIGNKAFGSCGYLESVSIPASVTSIGNNAFQDCGLYAEALTVSFAEGSTSLTIGDGAFNNANLKSIDIPNRVTSIGKSAFSYCTHLESVSIPASVTSIGGEAFQNCGLEAAALTVSFAEGSTPLTISEYAFYQANLKSIDIPNRVTSIGDVVFCGCKKLESVSIPASVTSIGNSAFSGCKKLESVSIPASVTSISEYAFGYCEMLAKVYIFAPNLTIYGANAFDYNADGRKIYVLPEAVNTYKAKWPAYVADIEAMPTYAITLAEGTKDAGKWTVKAGTDGSFQSLPLEGVKAGTKVKLKYDGDRSMLKGVTAVKKAAATAFAADEYNEASWDDTNKKVVFEKKKATTSPVAVADAATEVTWDAGWYTVSGNVTINGNVTLTADTHLILQDDATLTIKGQLDCGTNQKNLYIYGQKKGDGKLNVTNNSGIAINSGYGYRIDIHGGEVTASAAGNYNFGLNTGYLAVYGGKLTATSGDYSCINFQNTIDVYDGEVVATSNATSGVRYGIKSGGFLDSQILTVYGGKVTATGNGIMSEDDYGSGFGCYVKSGTSGIKFYFSADGTTWGDGTSYASATNVGTDDADAATKKRYAKAE